jgi:phosphohistidine phosphatase
MAVLELYLIRHGIAAERGDEFPDDSKRPLTSEGIASLRKEAKALDALGIGFDHIITSPLVRAKQTADVFAQHLVSKPSLSSSDALAPAGSPAGVITEVVKHARKGRIALVGHEPNLGELAGRLIGSKVPLEFKKGGIRQIDFEVLPPKGTGHLRWFVMPKMLRKIG